MPTLRNLRTDQWGTDQWGTDHHGAETSVCFAATFNLKLSMIGASSGSV